MFGKTMLSVGALLLARATAETAPGFPIDVSQNLTITYGNNTVSPGGELIPRPETAQPPIISSPVWWNDDRGRIGSCVLLMVDLDVPRNDTRVPLLHWLATNVTRPVPLSANTTGASLVVPSNNSVPYLQPSPPVGDIPHSYTFILMQQPRNFTLPEQYSDLADNRVGFNITQFAADANLTMGLAATWMTVQNVTETENENATSTSTFPPARPSETGGGDGDGPLGDGGKLEVGGKAFWAGMSTVLLAGVFAVAL